jgi:hypothetical protein
VESWVENGGDLKRKGAEMKDEKMEMKTRWGGIAVK